MREDWQRCKASSWLRGPESNESSPSKYRSLKFLESVCKAVYLLLEQILPRLSAADYLSAFSSLNLANCSLSCWESKSSDLSCLVSISMENRCKIRTSRKDMGKAMCVQRCVVQEGRSRTSDSCKHIQDKGKGS